MRLRLAGALCALCAALAAHAAPALVFLAPNNHEMPLAQFERGELQAGILKDLGQALAQRVGREARFLSIPSKRVGLALASGQADLVCYVRPFWISGDFHWSRPFLPNQGLIIARADAPPLRQIGQLADERVGTVIGYVYPQLELALGSRFVRDDAPNMSSSFAKLAAGRVRYAVIEQMAIDWQRRQHPGLALKTALALPGFQAQCALARSSSLTPHALDAAIAALVANGSIDAILARYK
ncbi:ABC transporter substrate-binding protein [Massilia sp. TS11]|uniref:substrate-binding periplasmic protein n=1 Tax=Massilia sp. TS11 TaxID=2908003 RepID=UPI001EDC1A79|nr:transporter substrate-binding domain-containing protein [Massilia sp. TS11]MCG2584819.1 transporter substrate-binding domain-containing protein [Massilia sp. TS11]